MKRRNISRPLCTATEGVSVHNAVTQLPFPALPPTANICHFHTKLGVQGMHAHMHRHTQARGYTQKVEADVFTCRICIHGNNTHLSN